MAASCDNSFCNSYLLLRPQELGLLDLLRLLFSPSLQHLKFVDSSEEREERFESRWIIFISLLVQKLLLSVAGPLSWVGSQIELWLNLVKINGGLGSLLMNFIRGKAVMTPEKTSAEFVSFIGNLDRRVDFDRNIRPGDEKYYAELSVMSSKASYENKALLKSMVTDHWKMEFLGLYDFWNEFLEKAATQAFMLRDKNLDRDTIVVSFRGTEPFNSDDWCSDFDVSWYELPGMGKIHSGFMKALGLQKNLGWPKEISSDSGDGNRRKLPTAYYFLREKLRALLHEDGRAQAKYILTGHSLGGALAVLFTAILALHEEAELLERLNAVYTFGQPRVGDGEFGKFMQKIMRQHGIGCYRFVYGNDMVPRLPYDNSTFSFKHFGECRYYNNRYEEQILEEVPNKNYFSPRSAIPMMVNAMRELMRSFTIVSRKGPEYRESTMLRILRVIGLLVPGLSAHCLMDYDNSIRLGRATHRAMMAKEKDG